MLAEDKTDFFFDKARQLEAWIGPNRDNIMQLIVACSSADAKGNVEIKKNVIPFLFSEPLFLKAAL